MAFLLSSDMSRNSDYDDRPDFSSLIGLGLHFRFSLYSCPSHRLNLLFFSHRNHVDKKNTPSATMRYENPPPHSHHDRDANSSNNRSIYHSNCLLEQYPALQASHLSILKLSECTACLGVSDKAARYSELLFATSVLPILRHENNPFLLNAGKRCCAAEETGLLR